MRRLIRCEHITEAAHIRNLLESQGIGCWIRNEFLIGGAGDLPLNECWPEIWLADARDETQARKIIATLRAPTPTEAESWTCQHCGEILEPQFGTCWNCGALRPD